MQYKLITNHFSRPSFDQPLYIYISLQNIAAIDYFLRVLLNYRIEFYDLPTCK